MENSCLVFTYYVADGNISSFFERLADILEE